MDLFAPNAVLKCNKLARHGHHYDYQFFKVTHVTKKGTVMGHYLLHSCNTVEYDISNHVQRWEVYDTTVGKVRKLPRPWSWELVTQREREEGIVACSCVR